MFHRYFLFGGKNVELNKNIKGIIIGSIFAMVMCILLFLITAFALTKSGYIPDQFLSTVTIILSSISCLVGGFISGRVTRKTGLLVGVATGFILFFMQLVISLIMGELSPTMLILIKAAALMLSGAIGGILGVNKHEKVKGI